MKIDMVIWSRDRAMQLDLLLRSTYRFFPAVARIGILWRATTADSRKAYAKVQERFSSQSPQPEWVHERIFKDDLMSILNTFDSPLVLGNSDDNVFIRDVDADSIMVPQPKYIAFSLRLNPQVNYCQPANLHIVAPKNLTLAGNCVVWDWTYSDPQGYWGYPHACDSNVYDAAYFKQLIAPLDFHNPRTLEIEMNEHRPFYSQKPNMISFIDTCLLNVCNNVIQDGSSNPAGTESPEVLTKRYLSGDEIELSPFVDLHPTQCHIVQPFTFSRIKM